MTDKIKNYSDPDIAFVTHVPVRWKDMDAYNHVNNASVATILEEARIAFIQSDPEYLRILGAGIVVADLNIQYKAQVHHDDSPLRVSVWISQLQDTELTLQYRLRHKGVQPDARPAIIASTRMVAFDLKKQSVRSMSEEEKSLLQRFEYQG